MEKTNVVEYRNPAKEIVNDQLSDFLRESAQKMLRIAVEAEADDFIEAHRSKRLSNNRQRVVRNGHLPEREIQTGIGGITVKMPRVRDQEKESDDPIVFQSSLVPKSMRRTATLDVLLPILYLKGISTGDFGTVLEPLLETEASSISPGVISRLKSKWYEEYQSWTKKDLSQKRYVYWWADGVYLKARMESEKSCVLVIVGADEYGKKEVVAIVDGFRESKIDWRDLMNDLQDRGLQEGPRLAIGDGSLGFWGALTEAFPQTQKQRCWVHKTANLLSKLPKSQQSKAKSKIHDIYRAANKSDAQKAIETFIEHYQLKYEKVVQCLIEDERELLTFYDFPAEQWVHLRTTNPIESTFATVRHRTKKSKNCFSRKTIIASVFKLIKEAEKRWQPLKGKYRIPQVIQFERFIDGIHENEINSQNKHNAA